MNKEKFKQIEFEKLKRCPYCSSENIFFLLQSPERLTNLPGKFSIYRCRNCGLTFQNPRIKEQYIGLYYSDKLAYCSLSPDKIGGESKSRKLKNFLKKYTLINHFNYNLGKKNFFIFLLTLPLKRFLKIGCIPYFRQGKLLEIGCSHGEFLERIKNLGWNVKGVEMNEKTASFAKEKRNLEVYNKRIEECSFQGREFDVVVMTMVLEHLYNPFEVLEKISQWLKKGGQLIFSIPYFNGFEFKWFKDYCYGLQLPFHITFFNKKVIKTCLKKLGYKDIKFYHQFFDRDIVASSQYKYQDTNCLFYKIIGFNKIVRFLLLKPFVFLLSLLNKTSRVTIYAHL